MFRQAGCRGKSRTNDLSLLLCSAAQKLKAWQLTQMLLTSIDLPLQYPNVWDSKCWKGKFLIERESDEIFWHHLCKCKRSRMNTKCHQLIKSEGYLTSCFLFTDRLQLFAFPFLSIFPECEIFANIGGEIALILYWNPYQPKLQSLSKSNYVTFVFESNLIASWWERKTNLFLTSPQAIMKRIILILKLILIRAKINSDSNI